MRKYEAWDGLPDPWEGNHDIDYWVWHEDRLVPATPEELACIKEDERTREALFRLERLHERGRREARSLAHGLSLLRGWCAEHAEMTVHRLRIKRLQVRSPHHEGARAERSSPR